MIDDHDPNHHPARRGPRPLVALPKAHLHVHLEGAMRPATLRDLCEAKGDPVPAVTARYATFSDFQALYVAARGAIASFEDLSRLVREVVEDAAADGAVWIEPAVNLSEHGRLGPPEEVVEFLVAAAAAATADTGVGVGWMVTVDRTKDPAEAVSQAQVAARYAGRGVVSLGLANDEARGEAAAFTEAFAVARRAGLLATPHAGEHGGPESVGQAHQALGAVRIQHGVRAGEDPALLTGLARHRVCLDVCPTSNVALGVVPTLAEHPLPTLLAAGVPCSINADDPLLFGVGLLDEYDHCRRHLGLGDEALAACARSSIDHSGAPPAVKARARAGIDHWLRSPE